MSSLQTQINLLEGLLRDEHGARLRQQELVGRQEQAVLANRPAELDQAVREMESELRGAVDRERRRVQLFEQLGRAFGVDPRALTVGSIAERAGQAGERLKPLRADLRRESAQLLRANRRLGALVRTHSRIVEDVLSTLFAGETAGHRVQGGALLDAEA